MVNRPAPMKTGEKNHDYEDNDEDPRNPASTTIASRRNGRTGAFIFPPGRLQQRVHARRDTAVKILPAKTRRDLVINDARRDGIRNRTLKPIPDLDPYFPVITKNEKDRSVVFLFQSRLPRSGSSYREILQRRILREPGKDRDDDLARGLFFKIL